MIFWRVNYCLTKSPRAANTLYRLVSCSITASYPQSIAVPSLPQGICYLSVPVLVCMMGFAIVLFSKAGICLISTYRFNNHHNLVPWVIIHDQIATTVRPTEQQIQSSYPSKSQTLSFMRTGRPMWSWSSSLDAVLSWAGFKVNL